jgi:Family of unknown function (DUF6502)
MLAGLARWASSQVVASNVIDNQVASGAKAVPFSSAADCMDVDNRLQRAFRGALEQLLRPLCRLLLRHSVPFTAFEDIAKRVYVDVAWHEFNVSGKKPTASRVAVLSGLTRKDVHRLLADPVEDQSETFERYNRATKVTTGWARDADFLDPQGKTRVLDFEGDQSFSTLVKRYSGDMPPRAVLDELLRVGSVERQEDGRIQMVTRGYVPQKSAVDKLGILGRDVADLIDTIDHNLQHGDSDPRFQRKVMYSAIPADALPAFRKLSATQGQALLERLDRWLAEHDVAPISERTQSARVGLGVFYFEDRHERPADNEEKP